jgi:hypothetical protein
MSMSASTSALRCRVVVREAFDRQKSVALLSRNEQLFGGFLSIIDC